jgi:hypothetical protein
MRRLVPRLARRVRPRSAQKLSACVLGLLLAIPGLALILGGSRYHRPFAPDGAHFLEQARNLAPITLWGAVLLVAGVFVPLMFSADAWVLGTAGCAVGVIVTFFLTASFVGNVPPGWFSAATMAPLCLASAGGVLLSIYDHVDGRGGGHAAGT